MVGTLRFAHPTVTASFLVAIPTKDASFNNTPLDLVLFDGYSDRMIKSSHIVNRKNMTHFGWAVKGDVR